MKLLLVDNEDSFTRILEHLLATVTGAAPKVLPYAAFTMRAARAADLVVVSPGPGHPADYPAYEPLVTATDGPPVLGVCLGMQIINHFLGGEVAPLPGCVHGRASEIAFAGRRLRVARYHSLHLSRLAQGLVVEAATDEGVIMAVRHETRPLLGYQFHPESFLTESPEIFIRHACARLLPVSA